MYKYRLLDTPWNTSRMLDQLKINQVQTVVRYYDFNHSVDLPEKRLLLPEAQEISQAGMDLLVIANSNAKKVGELSRRLGMKEGMRAAYYAKTGIGQPEGSAIYFAVDFDVTEEEVEKYMAPYFEGIQQAFREMGEGPLPYQIGAFGSGLVVQSLFAKGLINLRWLSGNVQARGTMDVMFKGNYELRQIASTSKQTTISNRPITFDEANQKSKGIGSFRL